MHKIITVIALGAFLFCGKQSVLAQSPNNQEFVSNNCIKNGDFMIDASYGWPFFNAFFLSSAPSNQGFRNTNHIGARGEYMISDNLGVGFEFTYADASVRYQSALTGAYLNRGFTKIRALPRINYHFGTSKNFDPYVGGGIGYKYSVYYDQGGANNSSYGEILLPFPVSTRLALGARFFFDDTFGLNAEIGLGGPLVAAGLTVKF
jgi:outer membrane protein W